MKMSVPELFELFEEIARKDKEIARLNGVIADNREEIAKLKSTQISLNEAMQSQQVTMQRQHDLIEQLRLANSDGLADWERELLKDINF